MARKRPCRHPACRLLTDHKSGFCYPKHYKPINKAYEKQRGSSSDRGYDASWRRVRKAKLNTDDLCERDRCGRIATTVHHKIPIEEWPEGRLRFDNLESLCRDCHEDEHPNRFKGTQGMYNDNNSLGGVCKIVV